MFYYSSYDMPLAFYIQKLKTLLKFQVLSYSTYLLSNKSELIVG